MKHTDFSIGLEFFMSGSKWRCTDVGTRTVAAIQLDQDDPSWYDGPPYAVLESVIDEDDLLACSLTQTGWIVELRGPEDGARYFTTKGKGVTEDRDKAKVFDDQDMAAERAKRSTLWPNAKVVPV